MPINEFVLDAGENDPIISSASSRGASEFKIDTNSMKLKEINVNYPIDDMAPFVKFTDYEQLAVKYKVSSGPKHNSDAHKAIPKRRTGRISNINLSVTADTKSTAPLGGKAQVGDCLQQANLNGFLCIKDKEDLSPQRCTSSQSERHKSGDMKLSKRIKISNTLFMSPRRKKSSNKIGANASPTKLLDELKMTSDSTGQPEEDSDGEADAGCTAMINGCGPLNGNDLLDAPTFRSNAFHFLMDRSKVTPPGDKSLPKDTNGSSKKRKIELRDDEQLKNAKRRKSIASQEGKQHNITNEPEGDDKPSVEHAGIEVEEKVAKPKRQKQFPPSMLKLKRNSSPKTECADQLVSGVVGFERSGVDLRRSARIRKSAVDVGEEERLSGEPLADSVASSKSGKSRSERNRRSAPTSARGNKAALIFDKVKTKPKASPASVAAKESFLRSGVPDALKRRQQQHEETRLAETEGALFVFPFAAHVRQRCSSAMWTLPALNKFSLIARESAERENSGKARVLDALQDAAGLASCCSISADVNAAFTFAPPRKGLPLYAHFVQLLSEAPGYPVRHCFVAFGDRNGFDYRPAKCGSRGQSKLPASRAIASGKPRVANDGLNRHTMWTKKYRPKAAVDLLGNTPAVQRLRTWLQSWLEAVDAPGGEMFGSDGASQLKNTTILYGGPGCGKSATVYALCEELGVNVLEVNVSGRRTGRQLLQQMHEATQSHQVGKRPDREIKMCLLLIDDVDLVYQQDELFTKELHTLITTSKRPIILTTNDYSAPHVMRYVSQQYPVLSFAGLSASSMAPCMQILCLMEGLAVRRAAVGALLEWNQGDMRRTLLQLQFWASSGGDALETQRKPGGAHERCVQALISHPRGQILPAPLELGELWWNIPNITGAVGGGGDAIVDMRDYARFMDSISFCDTLNCTERIPAGVEPEANNLELLDTIELNPRTEEFKTDRYLTRELQQYLLEQHSKKFVKNESSVDAVSMKWAYAPPVGVRRWRGKQQNCASVYKEALCQQVKVGKEAFLLDYFPYLRLFSRVEQQRQQNNPKRGNRGFNVLGSLGIYDILPSDLRTACKTFGDNELN